MKICLTIERVKTILFSIIALGSLTILASDAITNRDTDVKQKPAFDADVLEQLKKDTDVAILERERGWYRINTPMANQGWVSMLELRYKKAPRPNQDAKILSFIGLRSSSDNITATTGVRGIGETDIKQSKPDLVAVQNALSFQVDAANAKAFAAKINLQSRKIAYEEKGDE